MRIPGLLTWVVVGVAAHVAHIDACYGLSPGDVTVTAITPFAPIDSNNCAGPEGPHAMYLQVDFTNNTAATLSNVQAVLNGFPAGAASPPDPPTSFTLGLSESTNRFIGSVPAGATASAYWFVNYPCGGGSSHNYSVTLSDSAPGTVTSSTLTLTTRDELSAQAGGDIDEQTIEAGLVIGQTVKVTVHYLFGNPAAGADAMIQPAGNVGFDSGCFRLTKVDVTASTFSGGPIPTNDNRLYFTSVASSHASNTATVDFYFDTLCTGSATTLNPFADLLSGGQEKYSSNFGSCTPGHTCTQTFPTPTNPFTVTKSVSPTVLANGGTVTYTVTVTNTSDFAAKVEEFTDVLPTDVTYGALTGGSYVQAANSATIPSTGATGTISWVGQPTDEYAVPAHTAIQLIYTADVPSTPGLYTNGVEAKIGGNVIGSDSASVLVGATPTSSPSMTPTETEAATATATYTAVPPTATETAVPPTATETDTPLATATATESATASATPTVSDTATATASRTSTSTATATASAINTPTSTPTATISSMAVVTCPPLPVTDCRAALAHKSVLVMRRGRNTRHQRIAWRWKGDDSTVIEDLGNPLTSTGYAFCIYDYSADLPSLVYASSEPAAITCGDKPCWRPKGDHSFFYKDSERLENGAKRLGARASSSSARFRFVASGPNVQLPPLPLAQDPVVAAQLINGTGHCWGVEYEGPPLTKAKSRGKRFRDRN